MYVNLPSDTAFVPTDEHRGNYPVLPQRPTQPVCDNLKKYGYCKLGAACNRHHPQEYAVKMNLLGYPLRPGEGVRFVAPCMLLML